MDLFGVCRPLQHLPVPWQALPRLRLTWLSDSPESSPRARGNKMSGMEDGHFAESPRSSSQLQAAHQALWPLLWCPGRPRAAPWGTQTQGHHCPVPLLTNHPIQRASKSIY